MMTGIYLIRKERGMTQIELARRVNLSQPYIHDLELGNRRGHPETLARIAKVLKCTVNDLKEKED